MMKEGLQAYLMQQPHLIPNRSMARLLYLTTLAAQGARA
jgi:hypothetical protein